MVCYINLGITLLSKTFFKTFLSLMESLTEFILKIKLPRYSSYFSIKLFNISNFF